MHLKSDKTASASTGKHSTDAAISKLVARLTATDNDASRVPTSTCFCRAAASGVERRIIAAAAAPRRQLSACIGASQEPQLLHRQRSSSCSVRGEQQG